MKDVYQNISNLPNGVYQNKEYDLNHNRFYIKVLVESLDIKFLSELSDHPLNDAIYDSPNYWPLLHRDKSIGSAFQDYIVPMGIYKFVVDNDQIKVIKTEPNVSYAHYVDSAFIQIGNEIKKICVEHEEVVVPSGAGIDSLVLLSYIVKFGYLSKVKILNQANLLSRNSYPEFITMDMINKSAYANFENYFTPRVKEFIHDTLVETDLLNVINKFGYEKLKCYSTTKMFEAYSNTAFIYGFGGNETLLHHRCILDIVFRNSKISNAGKILQDLINTEKTYYANYSSIRSYDVNKDTFCELETFPYQYKPYLSFNGFNNNHIYFPLGSIAELSRMLDYSTVDFDTVLDAKMCREIIHRNVGSLFNDFISATSPFDSDNFINVSFDKSVINPEALIIPKNLNHNLEKLHALEEHVNNNNKVDHFTISVIKMLQHMDSLFNK
jgi:hypothetical protein